MYRIIRSRRRTLAIYIEQGQAVIRAPERLSQVAIAQFIEDKKSWIARTVAQQKTQLKDVYRIKDGATLPVLGEELTISLATKNNRTGRAVQRPSIVRRDGTLRIQIPSLDAAVQPQRQINRLFMRWIKAVAAEYMTPATTALAAKLELGGALRDVRYRKTRSKWGHCTSAGSIQYNPLIALAPLSVIDYLIAHEVCHLRHRNHSKRFWALLDKHCAERHSAEQWLKQQGYKLDIVAVKE